MTKIRDSYLVIYHGPIRGGKTASMTADGAIEMLNGRRVFSNYRIVFTYNGKEYAAEPLKPEELMYVDRPEVKKKYTDCVICIDEGALLMAARDFQTATNKLIAQSMLLRGKLELSVFVTVQFLSMFEKNMRIQEDTLVFCHDLSFIFRNLERGSVISQAFQDISGRSTGETYEYSGMVYRQTFRAKPFWYIYDTKEMPVSVVKKKVGMKDVRDGLEYSDFEKDQEYLLSQHEENDSIVTNLIDEFDSMGQVIIPNNLMKSMVMKRGFNGDSSELAEMLMTKGVTLNSQYQWNIKNSLVLV